MIKNLILTAATAVLTVLGSSAQIVTSTPSPLQANSQNVVIYYHADQGNKQLMNLPASTEVYAHTGVLLTTSTGDSDWKYAPTWGTNQPKYLMKNEGNNVYSLAIGDIYTYYGITNPSDIVKKLAFVFRTSDNSKEGKTATGGDIFLDVLEAGYQVTMTSSLNGETVITPNNNKVHFELGATQASDLTITVNGQEIAKASNSTLLQADYTFSSLGEYKVVGKGVKGDESAEYEMNLIYPNESKQADYPGGVPKMGPVVNEDGSVTFCLAAPGKKNVIMVGSWTDYAVSNDYVMNYQDYNGFRYFWLTLDNIKDGEMYLYYYLIDNTIRVADPYAKLVLDPTNDKYVSPSVYPNLPAYPTSKIPGTNVCLAIYQSDINDYNWTDDDFKIPAKTDLIVYELLFRDFTGTEGRADANGTVKKALEKLPYLKKLGVNVIELLPINEFNGNNSWGYNPNFYFAPDKAYGTPDDYKEFINTCHENGMAVVLDMVFNQSDWLHPWYQMYPVGQNPFYNATAPHAYSVLNDWNQGYPLVRDQWKDVVQYWINEYHVDGYRFDLVKGLGDNDSYANSTDGATNAYNKSRVENMRRIQEWMLEANPDALCINENLAGSQEENEMGAYGQLNWFNCNDAGCQFAMGYQERSNLSTLLATNSGRTAGTTISYLESHDEERLAYKQNQWGVAGVKGDLVVSMRRLSSAAAQMIMTPGSHMIWMFSELGNDETTKNGSNNDTDPKKVLWSYLDVPARLGLYWNYCELIGLRLRNADLFGSEATFSLNYAPWTECRYFSSVAGDKELHMVVNPQVNQELTYKVNFNSTNPDHYMIATKSHWTEPTFDVAAGTITVPANSYVVITSNNIDTGVEDILAESAGMEPVAEEWYTLTGVRVSNPDKGLYVRVLKFADGTSKSLKVAR